MAKKKQQIDQNTIVVAFDSAMDTFTQASSTDQLLAETGKSRQQLLDTVTRDDEVEGCREDLRTAILAEPWRLYAFDDTVPEAPSMYCTRWCENLAKSLLSLQSLPSLAAIWLLNTCLKKSQMDF